MLVYIYSYCLCRVQFRHGSSATLRKA